MQDGRHLQQEGISPGGLSRTLCSSGVRKGELPVSRSVEEHLCGSISPTATETLFLYGTVLPLAETVATTQQIHVTQGLRSFALASRYLDMTSSKRISTSKCFTLYMGQTGELIHSYAQEIISPGVTMFR